MIKTISKKAEFTNPITGEKKIITVSFALPDKQKDYYEKFDIDINSLAERELKRELDYRFGMEYINAIIDHAKKINSLDYVDLDLNINDVQYNNIMYKSKLIFQSIYKFIHSCTDPVVYTNHLISNILKTSNFFVNDKPEPINNYDAFSYRIGVKTINVVDLEGKEKEKCIPFFCIPSLAYDCTKLLVYDNENPKFCLLVYFKNVMK